MTPEELKSLMDEEKIVILDVREPYEFAEWHIPDSINIPVSHFMQPAFRIDLPKSTPIVTVCAHGRRSATAARLLSAQGYHVDSLDSGLAGWNSIYDIAETKVGSARLIQFRRLGKGCLSYALISGDESVVIDATIDNVFLKHLEGTRTVAVLDTHLHDDHISGGKELAKLLDAPFFAPHEAGGDLEDNTIITFGDEAITAFETSGHTKGSFSFLVGDALFTGDNILLDGVAQSADAEAMFLTVRNLLQLPENMRIFPSHYNRSVKVRPGVPLFETIGEMRQLFMQTKTGFLAAKHDTCEENELIKQHNTGKIHVTKNEMHELEAGACLRL